MSTKTKAFLLVILILAMIFGVWKEFSYLGETEQFAERTLDQAEAHLGKDSRTQNLRSIKNGAKEDLATLDSVRLTKTKLVSLIDSLDKIGKTLNLSLSITSITSEVAKSATSTPETVRVAINTEGAWASNLTFLHLLSALPYKASIEDSDLTKIEKGWRGSTILKLVTLPETK